MYTNIDTSHALEHIRLFFYETNICDDLNLDADKIMDALKIIMENNVFQFGDTKWRQKRGTAMGTPPAPTYVTLYFYIHERIVIPSYPQIIYYCRFIDDGYGIWIENDDQDIDNTNWTRLKNDFNCYGILKWEFSPKQRSLNFLDVTITFTDANRIVTTIYEKALNKYLYLPPNSAHPPGVLTGLIGGMLHRIDHLCTNCDDSKNTMILNLIARLEARGYDRKFLIETYKKIRRKKRRQILLKNGREEKEKNHHFFHLCYYPKAPKAKAIQKTFYDHISNPPNEPPLLHLTNNFGGKLATDTLTVAHHRVRNIGELLSYRKFCADKIPVSVHFRNRKQILLTDTT